MNGPLKIESESRLQADFDYRYLQAIKIAFIEALNSDELHHADIKEKVKKITSLKDKLGCYAEFWLLLATGTEIAEPRYVYSSKAASLRSNAWKCSDYSKETYIKYLLLTYEQHERRAARSNAALNPVIKARHRIAADHAKYRLSELNVAV